MEKKKQRPCTVDAFLSFINHFACSSAIVFLVGVVSIASCTKISEQVSQLSTGDESLKKEGNTKPNIIILLGDDVGYEIPVVDGGESYSTPNIDKMASEGMQFTRCHTSPLCSPSRFMLLTGKYNFRNYNNWGIMETSNRTMGNMLRDAGYKTLVAGKWQLGGGDTSIRALGFDDYAVWNPFSGEGSENQDGKGSRYKDPQVYINGSYMPKDSVRNKYGDDIFANYVKTFIKNNLENPFFVYYSICLVHPPFGPTPADAAFKTWDPRLSDKNYFPSMVNYMDAKVGDIMNFVKSKDISNNTLILYFGDNGTSGEITSLFNGENLLGGKGSTKESGTHVPLIAWWNGKIIPGSINGDLIDLTDFMPTLADVANIPRPTTYGILDGVSFAPALFGQQAMPRSWVFCHYNPNPVKLPDVLKRWAQDKEFKYYESGKFVDYIKDPEEYNQLYDSLLTPEQMAIKSNLQAVIAGMHN